MNLSATLRIAASTLGTVVLLAGCSALSEEGAASGRQITTAFYPLAYATERVAGNHFDVVNLTNPGIEPHELELSVRQTGEVAEARLVVFEDGFQPAVDKAVEQTAEGETLDAADVVTLLPSSEHEAHEEGHAEEDHEDEHEDHAEEDHEGHDHGELDPHFWLDPLLMADFADALAAKLSDLDAEHADDFEANAAEFRAELEDLDAEYADGLASCQRNTVVVNHDAFGYQSRYGLHFEAITGLSPGAEPTAQTRAALERLIREDGITTVFSEALGSKQAAESIADDLGIRSQVLDPIEGLSDKTSEEDYVALMRANLVALKKANGC
ncbi:zinc ABC transporter substrate-binding protein [Nocardioides sp. JQ2195]|uniref:metal ABC transporter substrate-binding protein n=1 Tax=Nocardioides sp. JQ2195 TaxID=2592334 RepID=UPI00143EAFA0|nr:metal ABC transporter substrate-binding protein [Nocardioides sp. JQ2195]QIX27332.1 zinc ABC transporter substrate-binding protein [Nocardioides sp. JQ2195]